MEIPTYTSQATGINLGPTPQADTRPRDDRVSSLASGFSSLASGLSALSAGQEYQNEALRRSQEQADVTRTTVAVSAAAAQIKQAIGADVSSYYDDPNGLDVNKIDGMTPRYEKVLADTSTKLQSEATTQRGKSVAAEHMAALWANHFLPQVMSVEAQGRADYAISNMDKTRANAAYAVGNDPTMFMPMVNLGEEGIRSAEGVPEATQRKKMDALHNELSFAAVNTMMRNDPGLLAVPTRGLLMRRYPGIAADGNSVAPVDNNPIVTDLPDAAAKELAATIDKDGSAKLHNIPVYKDASGNLRYGTPPTAAGANPEAPATPPTDAEIAAKVPAWKYLTPEHRQQFRNQAATLLNQQGALAAKQMMDKYHDDMAVAEKNIMPPGMFTLDQMVKGGLTQPQIDNYDNAMKAAAFGQMYPSMTYEQREAALDQLRMQAGVGTGAQILKTFDSAVSQVAKLNSFDAKQLSQEMQNHVALFKQGVLPDPIPEQRIVDIVGKDAAPSVIDAYAQARQMGTTINDLPGLSRDQVATRVAALKPDANDIASAKKDVSLWQAAEQAAKKDDAARRDDPTTYAFLSNPDLRAQHDAAFGKDGNPQAMAAYLQAVQAQQQTTQPNWKPQLLTKEDVANLSSTFNTNTAGFGSPDEQLKSWRKTVAQFGPKFGDVMAEYKGRGGKLPPELEYVNWLEDGTGKNLVDQSQAVQLAGVKVADDEKSMGVNGITGKQVSTGVEAALHDIRSGLVDNQENSEMFKGIATVVEKRAAANIAHGMGLQDAIDRAAAPVLAQVKTFKQGDGQPSLMIPASANPDLVRSGAGLALSQLSEADLRVPPTGITEKGEAAKQYLARVRATPVWISNGSSLGLYAPNAQGDLTRVLLNNGNPVNYTYNQLRFMAGEFTGVPMTKAAPPIIPVVKQ